MCKCCGGLGPNDDGAGADPDFEELLRPCCGPYFDGPSRDRLLAAISALAADRDAAVRRLDALTLPAAERRERIATACLAGMLSCRDYYGTRDECALKSVRVADALIAALDGTVLP